MCFIIPTRPSRSIKCRFGGLVHRRVRCPAYREQADLLFWFTHYDPSPAFDYTDQYDSISS